jgi:hypothetical protein
VPTKLTSEILAAAIEGFEAQKKKIDDKIAEIRQMLGGSPTEPSVTLEAPVGKRKKFSASARKRMKEAQRLRWAKIKDETQPPSPGTPVAPKAKRTISADGLNRIAAAQRERWAVKKAAEAQRPAKKAVVKKTAVKKAAVKKTATKKAAKKTAAKKSAPAPAVA